MTKKKFSYLIDKHGAAEVANTVVFPVKLNSKEQEETDIALSDALASRRASMSDEEKLRATLLQLRFRIEDYLKDDRYDKKKTFGYFLKVYIGNLKRKHIEFARDINIKPSQLSQYINNHRSPPQDIIVRLELHSHNIISAVDWYQLLEKKNLYELRNNKDLRREQKSFVKREAELV